MRVRALQAGFVGRYIEPGELFDCTVEQFSPRWMAKVEEAPTPPADTVKPQGGRSAKKKASYADDTPTGEQEVI